LRYGLALYALCCWELPDAALEGILFRIAGVKVKELIRIFIVDDHAVVRLGLKTMLESEPDIRVVGTAGSGKEALEAIPRVCPDIVVTDLRMREMKGAEMLMELRRTCPQVRSIVLTTYHSDEDVFGAMKAGAMAYVLKSSSLEQVTSAIRKVHAGEHWIPARISQQLAQRLSREPLSARETEILRLVARGRRNQEIAQTLSISENTVRNHVVRLLEKLGVRDRTEATAVALQQGLVHLDED
jgi:DNA-binding NarL/FixJ family response regulator